jgi:hypothetical protein
MRLAKEQSYVLFEKHSCYVKEACDRCGAAIHNGNRFTVRGDSGVWCSRLCRDGAEQRAGSKGGRPRKYRTEAARQRAEKSQNAERQKTFRVRVQRNGKPPCTITETQDLRASKSHLSTIPLAARFPALETAPSEI